MLPNNEPITAQPLPTDSLPSLCLPNHLVLRPQKSIQFLQTHQKKFDDFTEGFRRRVQIQETYSRSLETLSRFLDKYIHKESESSVSYICSAFKLEHQQRARQANELASSVKTEIYLPLLELVKKNSDWIKFYEKQVKHYVKDQRKVQEIHQRTLDEYVVMNEEVEQLMITKNIIKYTKELSSEKKARVISDTMEKIKKKTHYEEVYTQAVKQLNQFVESYNREIPSLLAQIEKLVKGQTSMETECMRKLIVCQVSMFKNIEYDLINISEQMETLSPNGDIKAFIAKNPIPLPFQSSLPLQECIVNKYLLSSSLKGVEEEKFSDLCSLKKNKDFRNLVSKIWQDFVNEQSVHKIAKEQVETEECQSSNQLKIEKCKQQQKEQLAENAQKTIIEQNQGLSTQERQVSREESEAQSDNRQGQTLEHIEGKSQKLMEPSKELREDRQPELDTDKEEGINELFAKWKASYKLQEWLVNNVQQELEDKATLAKFLEAATTICKFWTGKTVVESKLKAMEELLQFPLHRMFVFSFIEEYRLQSRSQVKHGESVCDFLGLLLQNSIKKRDTFVCRGVLGLIFIFYELEPGKQKKLLFQNRQIFISSVWSRDDFWKAAIFQSTLEEMMGLDSKKFETLGDSVMAQKNLIFNQLACFCHNMIMLGVTSKNVRQIVGRYCGLYELSTDQNKDLSKMITNTERQYKAVFTHSQ